MGSGKRLTKANAGMEKLITVRKLWFALLTASAVFFMSVAYAPLTPTKVPMPFHCTEDSALLFSVLSKERGQKIKVVFGIGSLMEFYLMVNSHSSRWTLVASGFGSGACIVFSGNTVLFIDAVDMAI